MSKKSTLRPCPFCGNPDTEVINWILYGKDWKCVQCPRCMARGPLKGTPTEAEKAWDRNAAFLGEEGSKWQKESH